MNLWKNLLVLVTAICLVSPVALYAVDEQPDSTEFEPPSIQNITQAERLENLAKASFSEEDMQDARDIAADEAETNIDTLVNEYANGVVDEIASDQAYLEVKQLSRDHAYTSVDTTAFPNLDERATLYADKTVEEKAQAYARRVAADDRTKYKEAYEAALARGYDPSFYNLWDAAYAEAIESALGVRKFAAWEKEYYSAYERGTGGGDKWVDAWQTAYESAKKQAIADGAFLEAEAYAYARATNPNFPNAYQAEYKKALDAAVAGIANERLREVYHLRYVEKLGLGVMAKKYLNIEAFHNGKGNLWRHRVGPSIDDEIIPPGPAVDPEEMSFEEELAEATLRNTRTGWNKGPGTSAKSKGNSKKWIGLNETSLKAEAAVSDVGAGNGKSSNGKGGSSAGAGQSNNSNKSQTSLSSTSSPSGKDKSNNGNNGRSSNSSKSDKNDRGNSGNNGKNDKNDRGNSGNNGNNGKGNR